MMSGVVGEVDGAGGGAEGGNEALLSLSSDVEAGLENAGLKLGAFLYTYDQRQGPSLVQ